MSVRRRDRPVPGAAQVPAHVRVHIASLVLDRSVASSPPDVARAVERELARLLGERLPGRLTTPGSTAALEAVTPKGPASASGLGSRVATAVHSALCDGSEP